MQCLRVQFSNMWRDAFRTVYIGSPPKIVGKRNILTAAALKVDKFMKSKEETLKFTSNSKSFKEEMRNNLDTDSNYLIFSQDLKKFLRLAETDEDLAVVETMLTRFYSQFDNLRFQQFDFGPEVMRLYYIKNKPVEAMYFLKKDEFSLMFSSLSSYLILADLLFNNQMYEEVLEVLCILNNKTGQSRKLPSVFPTLYFGACYKLNNPESYKKAQHYWEDLEANQYICSFRGKWFFAMLALLQSHYFPAIEILHRDRSHVAWNIRVIALAKAERYNDALTELNIFRSDQPKEGQRFICMETVESLEEELKKSYEHINKFEELKKSFVPLGVIKEETLDELLCAPLHLKTFSKNDANKRQQFNI